MPERLSKEDRQFPESVGRREAGKIRARRRGRETFWFGLGMFGVVGWSVALPTVAGVFLGVWIDLTWPGRYSWTLMLLVAGLALGCLNAWFWVGRQRRAITKEREEEP